MNKAKVKINGKQHDIVFPITEEDLKHQVDEILKAGYYDEARVKDGIIVDVGANIGIASMHFAGVAKKVYALEPNPNIFKVLKKNTKGYKNIECFNVGLSYENATRPFYPSKKGEEPQSIFGGPEGGILVSFVTITDFMKDNKIKHIDAMKMDVEGAEYVILPDETFEEAAKEIDILVGESHYVASAFPDVLPVILKDYGFKTEFIETKGGNYYRELQFKNINTGKTKTYRVPFNTMFIAKK